MDDFYHQLGRTIQMYRKKRRMTQVELGKVLHVSDATITKYEQGVNRISVADLVRLAQLFEVSMDDLVK